MISRLVYTAALAAAASLALAAQQTPEAADNYLMTLCRSVAEPGIPSDTLEQRLADFMYVSAHVGAPLREAAADSLARRLDGNTQAAEILMDYLGNPDSPMCNREQLILTLGALTAYGNYDEAYRQRMEFIREDASKNRVGSRAADFTFRTPSGGQATLYGSLAPEGQTLLIVYDPECESCQALIAKVAQSRFSGRVIAVTPGIDEAAPTLPAEWVSGFGPDTLDELYYLPVMPQYYLLDADGTVAADSETVKFQ